MNVYTHWLTMLMKLTKKNLVRRIFVASFNFLPYLDHTTTPEGCLRGDLITITWNLKRRIIFSSKFPSTQ